MLHVIFGREEIGEKNYVLDNRIFFRRNKKPEWFEDDFVKEFLYEIDGSKVIAQEALLDYRGRGISTEMISTGCKSLCCIYYCYKDHIFNGSLMGDNCIPFLMRIAENHDVTIVLEHYVDFPEQYFRTGKIMMYDRLLDQDDYDDAFSAWCAGGGEYW